MGFVTIQLALVGFGVDELTADEVVVVGQLFFADVAGAVEDQLNPLVRCRKSSAVAGKPTACAATPVA